MNKKILIVEDEADIIEILTEEFEALGNYQVLNARDGKDGLLITSSHNPDILILDIQLPTLNGFEVCRSIRSNPAICHTKILMISGMAQNSDQHKAMEMGADAYLSKPFNLVALVKKVEALLGSG